MTVEISAEELFLGASFRKITMTDNGPKIEKFDAEEFYSAASALSAERIEELQRVLEDKRVVILVPGGTAITIKARELLTLLSLAHSAASGSEWRPIESYEGGFVWLGFDDIQHAEKGRYCDGSWRNNYGHAFSGAPSHWMPLPPPPTKKEPENGTA